MTYAELQAAGFVLHHDCAACGAPVGWRIHPVYAAAVFDSTCDCGASGPWSYTVLTQDELAAIEAEAP